MNRLKFLRALGAVIAAIPLGVLAVKAKEQEPLESGTLHSNDSRFNTYPHLRPEEYAGFGDWRGGRYSYRCRYVSKAGDKSQWSPETVLAPPTVRFSLRVDNQFDYDAIEIRRMRFRERNEEDVMQVIPIKPGELSIRSIIPDERYQFTVQCWNGA